MLDLVNKTIDFYIKNLRKPDIKELENINIELLNKRWAIFVTIYHKGEIRWSAGNIIEIMPSLAEEIIENTIKAISEDPRFKPLSINESKEIKIRVDLISNRNILKDKSIKDIDPSKNWVIVIKKDYEKMAAVLPNIHPKLVTWDDFSIVLKEKLKEKEFNEQDYTIYEMETIVEDNIKN